MTIEDEKVSIDELIEDDLCGGPETSEYVQSCDIVAFNKICELSQLCLSCMSQLT